MASSTKYELHPEDVASIFRSNNLEEPKNISRFSKGMVNDVFQIDDDYVIKINTGNPELLKLEKEKEIFDMLRNNNILSSKLYVYDNTRKIIPYEYMVMGFIQGNVLTDTMKSLSKKDESHVLSELGVLLARIHSITFSEFGDKISGSKFAGQHSYVEYLATYVNDVLSNISKSRLLDSSKIESIRKYFVETDLYRINVKASLTHGNFIYDNILIKDGNITGIVDWEWARSAHNEEEVATFLYRVLKMDEDRKDAFMKGYESILSVDKDFEKRLYGYVLLYYLKVLPEVSKWTHRPDKQQEYIQETDKLIGKVLK